MSDEWKLEVEGFGVVRVCQALLDSLSDFCQLAPHQPESGGVLVGKHLNSGGVMLVNDFTPPQPTDKQGRCSYYRSEEHNKKVLKKWKESNGHLTFVGLWHTHPEPKPNFSAPDNQDWLNALKNAEYEGTRLFFIIVGQTHIRCWVGQRQRFTSKIEFLGEYKIGSK